MIIKQYDYLLICENSEDLIPLPPINNTIKINRPGITKIPGWKIHTSYEPYSQEHFSPLGIFGGTEWFNKDIKDDFYVRARKEGDLFYPNGLQGKKKLKTFMIDSKIPQLWRNRIPVISTDKQIAWVVGWRIAEWAKPKPNEPAIKIEFHRQYDN